MFSSARISSAYPYNIHERRQLQRQDHLGRPRHLVRCPPPTPSQPALTAPQRLGRKADLAAFGLDAGRSPQVCHP